MLSTLLDNAPEIQVPRKFLIFIGKCYLVHKFYILFSLISLCHSLQTRKPLDDQFGICFCPQSSVVSCGKFILFFYDQANKYFTVKCFEYSDERNDCQMIEW